VKLLAVGLNPPKQGDVVSVARKSGRDRDVAPSIWSERADVPAGLYHAEQLARGNLGLLDVLEDPIGVYQIEAGILVGQRCLRIEHYRGVEIRIGQHFRINVATLKVSNAPLQYLERSPVGQGVLGDLRPPPCAVVEYPIGRSQERCYSGVKLN